MDWIEASPALFAAIGVALAAWLGLDAVGAHRRRQWLKSMEDRHFLACPRCHYDLRGVPAGACPECGAAFDPDSLSEVWERARKEHESSSNACG